MKYTKLLFTIVQSLNEDKPKASPVEFSKLFSLAASGFIKINQCRQQQKLH